MLSDEDRALRKIARLAIMDRIKRGDLPSARTLTCSVCGQPADSYHHADYNKPLDVIPVCSGCHGFIHQREKAKQLHRALRAEIEVLVPTKRRFADSPKRIRLPNKTQWALRDMSEHARGARSDIEEALRWITEEHAAASTSADDEYVARLGDLTHMLAEAALNGAMIERTIVDSRAGIYTPPQNQGDSNQ